MNIYSLSGVCLDVALGQVIQTKLTVHAKSGNHVRFFSSHPMSIWFPPPFDKILTLTPGKINIITISLR